MSAYDRYWYALGFITLGSSLFGVAYYNTTGNTLLRQFCIFVVCFSVIRLLAYRR